MSAAVARDAGPSSGWVGPASGRIGLLSTARVGAQTLGFAWFVVAARWLTPDEFGACAAALTIVFVNGALADLGLTRTVSIRVARCPHELGDLFRSAGLVRVMSGVAVGAGSLALVSGLSLSVTTELVLLASVVATASGVTEIGFAALRAVGLVRAEVTILVAERAAFGAAAVVALAAGVGPVGVVACYAVTNVLSATAVTLIVRRRPRPVDSSTSTVALLGQLAEPNARWTAAASTLTVLAPRLAALSLMATATTAEVGAFVLAQKPAEALGFLAATIVSPVLPLLAADRRSTPEILARAIDFMSLAVALVAPGVALLIVVGPELLTTAFGAQATSIVGSAAGVLGFTALVITVHLVAEAAALARDDARRVAGAVLLGGAVTVVCVIAVPGPAVASAAVSALMGTLVALAVVVSGAPVLAKRLRRLAVPTAVRLASCWAVLSVVAHVGRELGAEVWLVALACSAVAGLFACGGAARAASRLRGSVG